MNIILTITDIQCLLTRNSETVYSPQLLSMSKYFYIVFSDPSPELYADLYSILLYAPHWGINKRMIATNKFVYTHIIKDLINSKHCNAYLIHGTLVK